MTCKPHDISGNETPTAHGLLPSSAPSSSPTPHKYILFM